MSSFQIDGQVFTLQTFLGSGAQGKTYLYSSNDKLYTVKIFSDLDSLVKRLAFQRETNVLEKILNYCQLNVFPCLYKQIEVNQYSDLFGVLGEDKKDTGVVIYNFIPGIPFYDLVKEKGHSLEIVDQFLKQMLPAIKLLHQNNIAHRDIKTKNIIYNPDTGIFTLIDFGLACINDCSSLSGSLNYILPSIWNGEIPRNLESYKRSDSYALGVCLYSYINKRNPFVLDKVDDHLNVGKYLGFRGQVPEKYKKIIEVLLKEQDLEKALEIMFG